MALATLKAKPIDTLLTSITGRNRPAVVRADLCMTCGKAAVEFKDDISVKEYSISGMCQTCQDGVFGAAEI